MIGLVAILLYVSFQSWKAHYRALAEFGRSEVAPVVDPLAELQPPGVAREDWRRAVADTHTLLVVLTTSGLLDRAAMEALRDELRGRVAAAAPATAIDTLGGIWDDLVKRAGPTLTVKPSRPPFPPDRPAILIKPADPAPRRTSP